MSKHEGEIEMSQLPDFCETHINHIDYFTCDLPVTAFGINDDMIMELCVEYGKVRDGNRIVANVWAHQKKSLVKHFIYSLTIAACQNPDEAIFEALNNSAEFLDLMVQYISEAAKHRCD